MMDNCMLVSLQPVFQLAPAQSPQAQRLEIYSKWRINHASMVLCCLDGYSIVHATALNSLWQRPFFADQSNWRCQFSPLLKKPISNTKLLLFEHWSAVLAILQRIYPYRNQPIISIISSPVGHD
ncbi:hypothetical protein BDV10DRAFT_25928 [Aspergillus recurvatus]